MTSAYRLSKHAAERMAERRIRPAWVAAALGNSPTLHTDRMVHYFHPRSQTLVVVDCIAGCIRTVYRVGTKD